MERRASLADAPAWQFQHVVREGPAPQCGGAAVATYITDHMRVSQVDAKCGGRVDASIHASHYSASLV